MHGVWDYSRLSVKRQGAHLKSLEKQRESERLVTAARHAVRYYGIDHLPGHAVIISADLCTWTRSFLHEQST